MPEPVLAPAETAGGQASQQSAALAAYYAGVQQSLLSQGLLRTDAGGPDAPFSVTALANNFMRIALFEEYGRSRGGAAAINLTRWSGPLRVKVLFGESVPAANQATDRARIASYLARLANLTGLSIRLADDNANVTVAITNVDERRNLAPQVAAAIPNISAAQISSVTNLNRNTYCLVWTQSAAGTHSYERAFVYIPAEHPDLMRLACMHEELAQALGLPNDSGTARPSIFNDDEEFALLTRQDELMLRILYNPALRNGMTEAEARPIVENLARQLLGSNT